jgi:hypothetical protein
MSTIEIFSKNKEKIFLGQIHLFFFEKNFFQNFDGAHSWFLFLMTLIKSKVGVQGLFCSFPVLTFIDAYILSLSALIA